MNIPTREQRRGRVSRLLDLSQGQGKLVVSVKELAEKGNLTGLAVYRQLARLSERVARLPGRPSAYLVVAPEHRVRGAPPISTWLDEYFRLRGQPYYVGLLSAAALHGSSQQAVQVTQLITTSPTRLIVFGRLRIYFFAKSRLEQTPLVKLRGLTAPLRVSTPEATALDLIAFSHRLGGIRQVTEVISGMEPVMSRAGLRAALTAESQTSIKQRLGYIFAALGFDQLAEGIRKSLPKRLAVVDLQTHAGSDAKRTHAEEPWMVLDNIGLAKRNA